MAGQTKLYRNVLRLEAKFQTYFQGKSGNVGKLRKVRLGLLRMLETGESDPQLVRRAA